MCYAVSTSPDPLGSWYRYEFLRPLFPYIRIHLPMPHVSLRPLRTQNPLVTDYLDRGAARSSS